MVAFQQRAVQSAIFYRAAINEQMLIGSGGARNSGSADQSPKSNGLFAGFSQIGVGIAHVEDAFRLEPKHVAGVSVQNAVALKQKVERRIRSRLLCQRRNLPDRLSIVLVGKSDLRIGEGD